MCLSTAQKWHKSPLSLFQRILRPSYGLSRRELCDQLAMSAMATGKAEGPHMSISNLCVEKLQDNPGLRRKQTHMLQTVTECFYLHAPEDRMGPMSTERFSKARTCYPHR